MKESLFYFKRYNIMPAKTDGQGGVFGKMWSTGEGNGKPLQHSSSESPMNRMKRQKDMTVKDETPRSVGIQYTTGEQQKNSSRRNEEAEPKWK